MDSTQNNAAMREALEEMVLWMRRVMHSAWFIDADFRDTAECKSALDKADSALAAPARNCDLYGDEDDAFAAWHDSLNDGDVVSVRNAFAWLFAKAEGGAE